jgi:hypothetical protein
MTVGCPNHLNVSTSHNNALLYWQKGNHPSIHAKINQVMTTMNKEEKNNSIIHVSHWLWWFVPHCLITQQHILERPGKKDRQIFDASCKYDWDSVPINAITLTPYGSELKCKFGSVCNAILIFAYNLRISYPNDNIIVHANDVKSCFCQIKHHPGVACAFLYILADYLFFQVGLAFGADFSPANWEAVHHAQSALAKQLFFDTSLVTKHHTVFDKIQWCRSLNGKRWPRFTRAFCDALNQGILDAHGNPVPMPHGVYGDGNIYLKFAKTHRFEQAIATSIEASHTALRQDPISWDKLQELLIAPVNRIIGLILDLRRMTIGTPPDFVESTINLLQMTWGPHRCSFKVKEAEELTRKLKHIAFGAPWLKYLLCNIYLSLASTLCLNILLLIRTSPCFREALCKIHMAIASAKGDAKRAFYISATARSVHRSNTLHHIGTDLHCDLRLIERTLSSPHCPTSCPI